ncbi:NYN domain-containing protein [Pseudofrankia sp. DC12]|uniref:NYN domain-containing protein n=1 Tax=Pseudofrankia sp. DC12 TaxID=683315 RepID=UPI0005F79D2D|nr:NYN domain-containing protein [Pseudofrankia sp. DC12]
MSLLAELGVAPWPVPAKPDAADDALLQHARYIHERGGRTFTVASADRQFADLAKLGDLEVIAWENQPVARALEKAATRVRRLPYPTTGAPTEPAPTAPREPTPTHGTTATSPARPEARPTVSSAFPGPMSALLAGLGIGVGQRLATAILDRHHLPRSPPP